MLTETATPICAACGGTGVVIVESTAVACSCECGDHEWAAKLNRARDGRLMPSAPTHPRNWQDREDS